MTPAYYADESYTTVFNGTPPVSDGPVYWNQNANGYRLPTEAEWEYACRAGTTTAYNNDQINTSCGDDPSLYPLAWYKYSSDTGHGYENHDVGLKQGNAFGLYDMHGNVEEWCWDAYDYYETSPAVDPTGPPYPSGANIKRGGGWSRNAGSCRAAIRSGSNPGIIFNLIGLRIVI